MNVLGEHRLRPPGHSGRDMQGVETGGASFENYLAQKWRAGQTQKRGRGVMMLSLDVGLAEGHFAAETADTMTPGLLFDREESRVPSPHGLP